MKLLGAEWRTSKRNPHVLYMLQGLQFPVTPRHSFQLGFIPFFLFCLFLFLCFFVLFFALFCFVLFFLLFLFFFFSSWHSGRNGFFWYRNTSLNTSVEESLVNLTNKWICFVVKNGITGVIPEYCDVMHHFLCEDANGGKIFHESWRKYLLTNNFTR